MNYHKIRDFVGAYPFKYQGGIIKRSFMKCLLIVVCLFTFLIMQVYPSTDFEKEIDQLSGKIAEKIAAASKKKIAVVDFTDLDGIVTELGRFLAEEFSNALAGTGKGFIVVDRIHLKTLLKEHNLSSTGLIDQNIVRQLGKIAGVDVLVTGSLTPLGESVRINVKVLDIETAAVIEAARGNIAMTDAIKSLMAKEISFPGKSDPGSTPRRTTAQSIQKVEEKGFVFEVLGCKVAGKTVSCILLITNKEKDRRLYIHSSDTGLFDDFGNEYPFSKIQIGKRIETYSISKVLFSGVSTKTILTFEDISPHATMASDIVIDCHSGGKDFAVKFRGIPFSK
jgi:TolB-like protein